MLNKKLKRMIGFLVKNSKMVLPIVIIIAVAVTVMLALKAGETKNPKMADEEVITQESTSVEATMEPADADVPLVESTMQDLNTLIYTYYNAYALGDVETLKGIVRSLDETEILRISAMSEYVESYEDFAIYTKTGPGEGSYLVYVYFKMKVTSFEDRISGMETFYVCTDDDGTMYFKENNADDTELEYIKNMAMQDDVVELYNRVNVECSDTFLKNEELFYYIQEIVAQVQKATGEALAQQMAGENQDNSQQATPVEEKPEQNASSETEGITGEMVTEPIYAKATTTVNVRASDSEQAEKVDKITSGTKVEILEQKVNGWSKVRFDKKEGFIKSEFLQLLNAANTAEVIGTVTATSNVNVRMQASENADRLGVLAGGEMVDLLGKENGWCKINYNGQIGYVKEDFVQ